MSDCSEREPASELIIASPYEGFAQLVVYLGLAPEGTVSVAMPHAEDLRGKHVLTDGLPFSLACYAEAVTCVELMLPPDIDSLIAPWRALLRFAQPPRTFIVSGSSREQGQIHAGGTTALATAMARFVMGAPVNLGIDEIASRFDQLMWPERKAGIEAERILVRALGSERDRRIQAEAERMRPIVSAEPTSLADEKSAEVPRLGIQAA